MPLIVVDIDMFILLSYREQKGELAWMYALSVCVLTFTLYIFAMQRWAL